MGFSLLKISETFIIYRIGMSTKATKQNKMKYSTSKTQTAPKNILLKDTGTSQGERQKVLRINDIGSLSFTIYKKTTTKNLK